jgi:MFS family permease
VACAVLFGLSAGAVDAALNAYAARHFGVRQVNLMHAAYGIGAATSPLIVTAVIGMGRSWRWAYITVMAIQALLAALFAGTLRRWRDASAEPVAVAAASTEDQSRDGHVGGGELRRSEACWSSPYRPALSLR